MAGVGLGMARWITRLIPLDPECVRADLISRRTALDGC
jgi:hypothetical protein